MRRPGIIEFVTDPQLLGLALSDAQETLLRAIYGLPLSETQTDLWRACTGRGAYPRRTRAGGRDVVDHPRGGHDDYANVLALAAVAAMERGSDVAAVCPIAILKPPADRWLD